MALLLNTPLVLVLKGDYLNHMANDETKRKLKDANFCIGTGVGVGLLGAGSAVAMGVVCPLCVFITPLLVGAGLVQRIRVKNADSNEQEVQTSKPDGKS